MDNNQEYLSPEEVLFQKVLKQYEAKNWQQTITLCMQLQSQVPQFPREKAIQFYDVLGKSLQNEQRYDEALAVFNTVIRDYPNTYQGLEGLIQLFQAQKNWEHVAKLAVVFQKFFPDMWQGYWYESLAYKESQDWEKAQASFQYLTQHFPQQKAAWENLVQIAQKNKNWQEVISLCAAWQQHIPEMWQSWWWKGQAHRNLKQLDEAAREFTQLQERFPKQHHGLEGMINVAQSKQNWADVVALSAQFQAANPNLWQGWWWKGQAHRNLKQLDEATHEFTQLQERFPTQHQGLEGMINVAQSKQNWADVVVLSAQFQAAYQHMWQGWWWKGQAHRHLKQFDEAAHEFTQLQERFPKQHQGLEGMINVTQSKQDWENMCTLAAQFQTEHSNMWQGWWWKGQAHRHLHQFDEATDEFTQLQQRFPQQHQGLEGAINVAQSKQNWEEVLTLSTQFQTAHKNMWQGWWWKGQAHRNLRQFDEASDEFGQLQQRFPTQHQGLEGMINVAQSKQNWEDVLALSTQFQTAHKNMWQGWWWKGQAHRNLKQFDEAAHEFTQLQERFPRQHQGLEGMINVAQSKQNWEDVLMLSAQFQTAYQHMWQGWWWKGQAHRNLKQFDEAAHEFTQLQERFPKQHQGLEGMINVAQSKQNWEDVLALSAQFQAAHSNMWQGWWWKGQAYRHLKQFDDAINEFTQLQQRFPKQHQGLEGVINVAQSQQNWQALVELAKHFQSLYPHMWQGSWWQIEAMHHLQQNDAVDTALVQFAEKFPEHHPRLLKHIQKSAS